MIATPSGDVAVEDIAIGMAVWTSGRMGGRTVGRVVAVGWSPVPATHRVVHLVLDDGRTLDVSPGHPLPDGRRLGDLPVLAALWWLASCSGAAGSSTPICAPRFTWRSPVEWRLFRRPTVWLSAGVIVIGMVVGVGIVIHGIAG